MKREMSLVIQDIDTTADKIRALLREGYLRTEVRDFLGISYQQVRNAAVSAGIEDGLQREGVQVVSTSKTPKIVRTDVAVDVLIDGGFSLLGSWITTDVGIGLSAPAPRDPGVYAFVVSGRVKYVGLSKSGLHRRMYNYQKPGPTQTTSQRLNEVIAEHTSAGTVAEIYIAIPPTLEWNGLPIHSAAGLEAGLIDLIQPPWNKMGVR